MATCNQCNFFFPVPKDADDYAEGKGDCIHEQKDQKGKFWLSKPTFENNSCSSFKEKH